MYYRIRKIIKITSKIITHIAIKRLMVFFKKQTNKGRKRQKKTVFLFGMPPPPYARFYCILNVFINRLQNPTSPTPFSHHPTGARFQYAVWCRDPILHWLIKISMDMTGSWQFRIPAIHNTYKTQSTGIKSSS